MYISDFKETQYVYSDSSKPTLTGTTGETGPGIKVYINIGAEQFLATYDPLTGGYSWTPGSDIPDGSYSYSVRTVDRAGNTSKPLLRTLVIDTVPPEPPVLIKLIDNVGDHTGNVEIGGKTDDTTPTLIGSAQRGATVYLRDASGQILGSAVADADTGIWQLEPTQALHDGINNLTLVTEERFAGKLRSSVPSAEFAIEIGEDGGGAIVLPPQYVSIINASDNAGSNVGLLSHDSLTDDDTPQLHGYVSQNYSVVVYYRLVGSSEWAGSETATVSGQNWDWTPSSALPHGSYEFQAGIGDALSAPFYLNIVSWQELISRTVVEFAIDNVGNQKGIIAPGGITDDSTPELRGRGEANATLWLFSRKDDGTWQALGTTTANSSGIWSYTTDALEPGRYEFKASPVNDDASTNNLLTMQIIDPTTYVPVIEYAYDDIGVKRGPVFHGETTDDKAPEFIGHGLSNSLVYLELSKNGGAWQSGYSVQVAANGVWKIGGFPELTAGNWSVRVKAEGATDYSNEFSLKVAGLVDGRKDVIENFNQLAQERVQEGDLLAIGQVKEFKYAAISDYAGLLYNSGKANSRVLTFNGGQSNIFEFAIELNQQAVEFSLNYFSFDSPVYLSGYDAEGKLVNSAFGIVDENYFFKLHSNGHAFSKIVILGGASTDLDNLKATFTGDENPNATWLNHPAGQDTPESQQGLLTTDHDILSVQGQHHFVDLINRTLDAQALQSDIQQANTIDLRGAGNTLKLDSDVILAQGEDDLFIADGKTQLLVQGGSGDVVQISDLLPEDGDLLGWSQAQGHVTVAGVEYQVYHHQGDDAELLVQEGVKVELI